MTASSGRAYVMRASRHVVRLGVKEEVATVERMLRAHQTKVVAATAAASSRLRGDRRHPPSLTMRRPAYYGAPMRTRVGVLVVLLCGFATVGRAAEWVVASNGKCVRRWTPSSIGNGPI